MGKSKTYKGDLDFFCKQLLRSALARGEHESPAALARFLDLPNQGYLTKWLTYDDPIDPKYQERIINMLSPFTLESLLSFLEAIKDDKTLIPELLNVYLSEDASAKGILRDFIHSTSERVKK